MEEGTVRMIDQRRLPCDFVIHESRDYLSTVACIRDMVVRGAPAIGATAAYAMAQAVLAYDPVSMDDFQVYLTDAAREVKSARPTAYDLFYAVDRLTGELLRSDSLEAARENAIVESASYADESAGACKRIGEVGEKLIGDGSRVLTHCNAGALACVDYGTALSPVRFAHYAGKDVRVYVDETRPRLQGANLTAWELLQEGIEHYVIVDNAAGYFMSRGDIDLVIVGADRVTREGDVINKIGTYEKAVLARENGIPFYVAAPATTFDESLSSRDVVIEERTPDEVLFIGDRRIAPHGSGARNPGFDITPKRYVTGMITEEGIK